MRDFRTFWDSPNCRQIRKSVELRSTRRDLIIVSVFVILLTLLLFLPGNHTDIAYILVYFLVFLPVEVYMIYRVVVLFCHVDQYVFTEAKLDKPHMGGRNVMYFTVTLRDRWGGEFQADTRPIFSNWNPRFEDYVNQTVTIAYNEATKCVVVIGKVPDGHPVYD